MKVSQAKLKQIIKEAIRDFQGEFNPSANVPAGAFGGDEPMKRTRIQDAAEFYSIPAEELAAVLDSPNRTAGEIEEILTNALIKAHKTMPFDEKYGPGKEARIGEYVIRILKKGN